MPKVKTFKIYFTLLFAVCIAMLYAFGPAVTTRSLETPVRILVFTKTKGYYHTSIPAGIKAIQQLGKENNYIVDTTKDASFFTEDKLKQYSAVIFLSTTMNVLNDNQQVVFERYIEAGGGFVGIHAAADTEYDWPWYNKLVGAYFKSHPNTVRKATINVIDHKHISTKGLPDKWERTDEWYNYKNIQPDIKVLATLDENSYEGGENGDNHPIAWYHEFDGGRAFYTGGGHTDESFSEPLFLQHLLGGIKYAIGNNTPLDYTKAYAVKKPEENRFVKNILFSNMNEPMQLAVANDGRVFFIERGGNFYVYTPQNKKTTLVYKFPVAAVERILNGMLGITIDPDFDTNHFIYFYFSTEKNQVYKQHLSRFTISKDNVLDLKAEKVLLEIPIDAEPSAHAGGSLAWDSHKNLFLSVGDNTVPSQSEGYAPLDRRPGRSTFDSERSAGNTNDLRGKILRIHPEADGTYTIPDGNLFPKGTPLSRPEIYVMGCRNPYRITVDKQTDILYWGEIGPDAGSIGPQGSIGFDEFNQAKQAGFYGWPYFVGDNQPYNEYDFATEKAGKPFDVNGPENLSPHNTGARILPPAHKAMIWYPYVLSPEFPLLGKGTRCSIGGPVYHYDKNLKSATKFPEYYDKALFIGDFMRYWIFAVRFDENNNYKRMEPFMETNGDFRRPIDMKFGPDGSFYLLEYGSGYGLANVDARLVRVDYNDGNRAPVAKITTRDTIGLIPFKVALTQKSFDYDDDDKITYKWILNGKTVLSTKESASYTFRKNGTYKIALKVTDLAGKSSTAVQVIRVGNTPPKVAITTNANSSFFFPATNTFDYKVIVKDHEDKIIDPKKIKVGIHYLAKVESDEDLSNQQNAAATYNYGKSLMAKSDCKGCHQINGPSVGPAFMLVSKRYAGNKEALNTLANKVIKGGSGVWGDNSMSAHPQLTKDDATEIVKYVLSLSTQKPDIALPPQGIIPLKDHQANNNQGRYILTASYTDKGGVIGPLTTTESVILRPAKIQAGDADEYSGIEKNQRGLFLTESRSYLMVKNIDLKNIDHISYSYGSRNADNKIEVHADSPRGPVVSTISLAPGAGGFGRYSEQSTPVTNPGGKHDLYFVFLKNPKVTRGGVLLNWINFEQAK